MCRLRSIAAYKDNFVRRQLSVRVSVCPVDTLSWLSRIAMFLSFLWSRCSSVSSCTLSAFHFKETHLLKWIKRIFHGVMVRIEKVEPEGRRVRSGQSLSKVQITGLPEGSTFPNLTNDPVIDYFSCLSTFIDHLTP